MFKIKKADNQEQGVCLAARCKNPSIEGAPIMLCNEHGAVWQAAGMPSLAEMMKRPPRKDKPIDVLADDDPDNLSGQLAPLRPQVEAQLQQLAAFEPADQAGVDWLDATLLAVQKQLLYFEDLRKAHKAPHLAKGNAVDAQFRPFSDTLKKCEEICADKLRAFAQAAAGARASALLAIGGGSRDGDVLAVVHGGAPTMGPNFSATSEWTWEVENMAQVPEQFTKRVIDDEMLDIYVKNKGSAAVGAIPGVRVFQSVDIKRKRGALHGT